MTDEAKVAPINACYVNEHCIGCATCVALAPDLFVMESGTGHAKMTKQPGSPAEVGAFKNAQAACPVAAIIGEPKAEMKQAA